MQTAGTHAVTRLELIFEAVNLSKQPAQPFPSLRLVGLTVLLSFN